MLDGRGEGGGGGDYTSDSTSYGGGLDNNANSSENISSGNAPNGDLDDEIPF